MGLESERQKIEQFFQSAWAGATPVSYDGVAFEPPADESPFITMSIMDGEGRQIELGTKHLDRYAGMVQHVISTKAEGTGPARVIADQLAAIWRSKQLALPGDQWITFRIPNVRSLGIINGRFQMVLWTNFQRDEFSTTPAIS
jgi:hypothetical protein